MVLAHHPKKGEKQGPAVEPGVVRISNRVLWMSGYSDCLAEDARWEGGVVGRGGDGEQGLGAPANNCQQCRKQPSQGAHLLLGGLGVVWGGEISYLGS